MAGPYASGFFDCVPRDASDFAQNDGVWGMEEMRRLPPVMSLGWSMCIMLRSVGERSRRLANTEILAVPE